MKTVIAILVLSFSLQIACADEVTNDLDRLLRNLDQKTNEELQIMQGPSQAHAKTFSVSHRKKSSKGGRKIASRKSKAKSKKHRV